MFNILAQGVTAQAGHVSLVDVSEFFVEFHYPICNLETWIDQFYPVLGFLQDRLAVDLHELVDVAEAWGGLAGGDGVAYAVRIDFRSLSFQIGNEVFVQ